MPWSVIDNELLSIDENNDLVRVSADELWDLFSKSASSELSAIGIQTSSKIMSVRVVLSDSCDGPFGQLTLEAVSFLGVSYRLSNAHASDHVIVDGVWHPLQPGLFEEINRVLGENHLSPGQVLTAKQYMICLRDLSEYDWFVIKKEFKAKEWSEEQHSFQTRKPAKFTANLSDYQVRGSDWLTMMRESGVGVVLGDGMGLGKTVQVIKTICDLIETDAHAKTLVICPSALVENWVREIEKFTKDLTYLVHRGGDRSRNYRTYVASVMITTYDIARMDAAILSLVNWDLVVLDEAQFIKNPNSQRTIAIKTITREASIAVTGTPFENHMTDIWSLYDYCLPGFLGSVSSFCSHYGDDEESAASLGRLIAPVLLRRRLEDVPNDLPPIVTIPIPIALEPEEAEEYERRRRKYLESGATLGAIVSLVSDLAIPANSENGISNLKYEYLDQVVEEVAGYREKIIVFAERRATIAVLEKKYSGYLPVFVLNGDTPMEMRQQTIDAFSDESGAAMLICNPTVGGAGLNITAANHVFHFSMQWNPAKIDQADARAHRRGQEKTVIVHYPYYASTVEEYMWKKVETKRSLAKEVVIGNMAESDVNDVSEALGLSPINANNGRELK